MKNYIKKHDDEDGKIMAEFNTLIALDKKNKVEGAEHLEAAGYLDVKKWFLAKLLNERVLEEIEPLCPLKEEREIEPTYESIMVEIFGHV